MNQTRLSLCVPLLLSALLATSACAAQGEAGSAASEGGYTVCAGDVLDVAVFSEEELSGTFPVSVTGKIRLALIGDVQVAGYTPAQVEEKLTEQLKRILKRPHVTVALNEQASRRRVYVTGEVKMGGAYELPLGAQPMDAVGAAAGFNEFADPSAVQVVSAGEIRVVDLSKPSAAGLSVPGGLRAGDFVYVPRSRKLVMVVGHVARPGRYLWEEGMTILDAVGQLAGGPLDTADLPAAALMHADGTRESVNLGRLLSEGELSENRPLQPGDSVVVPRARAISVVGQVGKPSSFGTSAPIRVLDAIAQAGGLLPNADLAGTFILRGSESIAVNLDALLRRGDVTQNVPVEPGDVLVVPEAERFEILVVGEVSEPGSYAPRAGLTALGAITEAGGPTKAADLARVTIVRAEGSVAVDLSGVAEGSAPENNVSVRPGDVILVPAGDKVYVFGGVRQAGVLPMPEEKTLVAAISLAGGPTPDALLGDVRILRTTPGKAEPEVLHSNFGKLLQDGDPKQNVALQPGDVIFVPEKGRPREWNALRDILWTAGWIFQIFR